MTSGGAELLQHLDQVQARAHDLLQDLSDEEVHWEPVPGCWGLRPASEDGWRTDWSPMPDPEPFTTIGWRLAHVGQSLAFHARRLFGAGEFSFSTVTLPGTAAGLMAFVDSGFELWRRSLRKTDTASAPAPAELVGLINHAHDHVAEVGVIRHLFRTTRPVDADPFIDAVVRGDVAYLVRVRSDDPDTMKRAAGSQSDAVARAARQARWETLRLLLDFGFAADSTIAGATAVHYAVAAGEADALRLLLDRGAPASRRDDHWHQTPLQWAEYLQHLLPDNPAAELLRSLEREQ